MQIEFQWKFQQLERDSCLHFQQVSDLRKASLSNCATKIKKAFKLAGSIGLALTEKNMYIKKI